MLSGKKAMRELCVAYHSCLKKLVKVPRWTRNHNLCMELKMLTCPMLIASRQLLFWKRATSSQNSIINDLNRAIGEKGLVARNHRKIRTDYELLELDINDVSRKDVGNMFSAHLERVVQARLMQV